MFPLIESPIDIVKLIFLLILGYPLAISVGRVFGLSDNRSLLLYVWHTFFAAVYALYVSLYGGDMRMYYLVGVSGYDTFAVGTDAVRYLSSVIHMVTSLPFLGMGILFSYFGLIGLIAFDASLRHVTRYSSKNIQLLATALVFLPSVSFWSAGLGKDAISFMAIGLAIWAAFDIGRRKWLMVLAIAAMTLVRPHIAGIMIMALAFSALFDKNANIIQRVVVGLVAFAIALSLVPFAMNYSGLGEDADSGHLISYIETRQGYNLQGGGGVNIANMSLPMQMFTYLFRPFIFEVRSVPMMMASIDNLILLYLFIFGLLAKFKGVLPHPSLNTYFIWTYSIGALLILSMTTANLGIAMRQKWMFVPFLMILLLSYVANRSKPMHAELKTPLPLRKPRF